MNVFAIIVLGRYVIVNISLLEM